MEQKKFKCKDEVVYRNNSKSTWFYGIISHIDENGYHLVGHLVCTNDTQVLHYEGNAHLVGTTDSPEEEIKLEKGDVIVCSDSVDNLKEGVGCICKYRNIHSGKCVMNITYAKDNLGYYRYCIPFSKFNPNDLEANKKEILKVENGKLVKVYK